MFLANKKKLLLLLCAVLFVGVISFGYAKAAYLTTNRDTKLPPDKVTYDIVNTDEFEKLYETDTMIYYYREDRDVFAIKDKRNGYTWKSGLDIPFGADVTQQVMDAEWQEPGDTPPCLPDPKPPPPQGGNGNTGVQMEF